MKISRMASGDRSIECSVLEYGRASVGLQGKPGRRPHRRGQIIAGSRGSPSNHGMARRLRLDEAVDMFLDHLKVERGLAAHTLDAYGRDLSRLLQFLTDRHDVDDVTSADLTNHLIALAEARLSARSRARALVAMRGLFRHLVAERWLDADPSELIDAPRVARRLPGVVGEDAIAKLIAQPADTPRGRRDAAMIELAYASGL